MHAAQRQHGFRYLLLLLLVAAPSVSVAGARNSSVGVRNDVELQQALLDPGVSDQHDQQLSWLPWLHQQLAGICSRGLRAC